MSHPADDSAYPASCPHTHLFPGERCRIRGLPDPGGFAADPRPVGLVLRLRGGAVADAELFVADAAGASGPAGAHDLVLAVSAYTTEAGTPIARQDWLVREVTAQGDEVEIKIGTRSP